MIYDESNFAVYYVLTAGIPNAPQWERKPDDWTFAHYAAACLCSIRALRETGYEGEIKVIGDDECFDKVSDPDFSMKYFSSDGMNAMQASRFAKTSLMEFAGREKRILFLDVDLVPLINPLAPNGLANTVFGERQVVAAAFDMIPPRINGHATDAEYQYTTQYLGKDFRQFNTGVLLFDCNERSKNFFHRWCLHWFSYRDIDQLSFLRAAKDCAIKNIAVKVLEPQANCNYLSLEKARLHHIHNYHPYGNSQRSRELFAANFSDFDDLVKRFGG